MMNPKLIVEQKITAFVNQYSVYAATADGQKAELVAFAQQKRIALKEKITFYNDIQKSTELFSLRAEKTLDIHGRYLIEDATGQQLGAFEKQFKKSLINSTWAIMRNNKPHFIVSESNTALAVLRRYAGFLPFVGEIVDLLMAFLKYHFVFKTADGGQLVGKYQKTTLFRDNYVLEMDDATYASQDWRVWAAFGVALDALQSR